MVSGRVLLTVVVLVSCGCRAEAVPATECAPGHSVTVTGKILSGVARQTVWSIWLKRKSTDCDLAAVIVEGTTPGAACNPGSRVTATGIIGKEDTLRSTPTSVSCAP